jgi:RNA polymerase sigma-70 factor (ECF subfamily)
MLTQHSLTCFPRTYALLSLFVSSHPVCTPGWMIKDISSFLNTRIEIKWSRSLIKKGFDYLEMAAEPFEVSAYHLEAAIASIHAAAASFDETDWNSIYHLYELLYQVQPNPVVALNKGIASAVRH